MTASRILLAVFILTIPTWGAKLFADLTLEGNSVSNVNTLTAARIVATNISMHGVIDMGGDAITNLSRCVNDGDAANKKYVDDATNILAVYVNQLEQRVQQQAEQLDQLNTMVVIPAGYFAMGDTFNEGNEVERPVHTNFISAFYMDKYEVTYTRWTNVYQWAMSNGYSFANAGSGKAATHPVQMLNWYDCVKWCNARSEKAGLIPCYYTNSAQTLVYRGGQVNLSNEWVKWTANGYRLPTEAEWEKAARGAAVGMRFPWSQTNSISHDLANLENSGGESYQYGSTGYHPTFATGGTPYTSPAGSFAPNGYGLYDMAGNVYEWLWDWYGDSWYSNAGATQSDTRGPVSGIFRMLRGGCWQHYAYSSRCAYRSYYDPPDNIWNASGFRCVRGL